jgi:hypothetical protein
MSQRDRLGAISSLAATVLIDFPETRGTICFMVALALTSCLAMPATTRFMATVATTLSAAAMATICFRAVLEMTA